MVEPIVYYTSWWNVAIITSAIYCPDAYLIMLVVRRLLTIMFTQRSSYIDRLQVKNL